jgi:hypothetical protein
MEPLLSAIFPDGRKPNFRRLSVRLDNCSVHWSKASESLFTDNSIVRGFHLAYSPVLTPPGVCLFDQMRGALAGQQSAGPAGLLDGIRAFLDEIQRSEVKHIFHRWIERVPLGLHNNGGYFHESISHHHRSSRSSSTSLWLLLIDRR